MNSAVTSENQTPTPSSPSILLPPSTLFQWKPASATWYPNWNLKLFHLPPSSFPHWPHTTAPLIYPKFVTLSPSLREHLCHLVPRSLSENNLLTSCFTTSSPSAIMPLGMKQKLECLTFLWNPVRAPPYVLISKEGHLGLVSALPLQSRHSLGCFCRGTPEKDPIRVLHTKVCSQDHAFSHTVSLHGMSSPPI